jgi:hypothetical protein
VVSAFLELEKSAERKIAGSGRPISGPLKKEEA